MIVYKVFFLLVTTVIQQQRDSLMVNLNMSPSLYSNFGLMHVLVINMKLLNS